MTALNLSSKGEEKTLKRGKGEKGSEHSFVDFLAEKRKRG